MVLYMFPMPSIPGNCLYATCKRCTHVGKVSDVKTVRAQFAGYPVALVCSKCGAREGFQISRSYDPGVIPLADQRVEE